MIASGERIKKWVGQVNSMGSLRQRIHKISESKTFSVREQISALINLGLEEVPEPKNWSTREHLDLPINCHAYTLGLGSSNKYREIAWNDAYQKKTHSSPIPSL